MKHFYSDDAEEYRVTLSAADSRHGGYLGPGNMWVVVNWDLGIYRFVVQIKQSKCRESFSI